MVTAANDPVDDPLRRVRHGTDVYHEVVDFLLDEAALLDDRCHDEWLSMLTDDVRYLVPVRLTTARTLATSTSSMAHFDEDLYSLRKRVERFQTDHAWAEDPPSRTRRFVTNIRCWRAPDEEIEAESSLLVFRSRGDIHEHDLLSGRRRDRIRRTEDGLRLAAREVWLDESVLRTQNLAIFL
jgi:3-phenylpropionate/cinnamic acid dioxygenase small subunit